jgi:hypothetical protein
MAPNAGSWRLGDWLTRSASLTSGLAMSTS